MCCFSHFPLSWFYYSFHFTTFIFFASFAHVAKFTRRGKEIHDPLLKRNPYLFWPVKVCDTHILCHHFHFQRKYCNHILFLTTLLNPYFLLLHLLCSWDPLYFSPLFEHMFQNYWRVRCWSSSLDVPHGKTSGTFFPVSACEQQPMIFLASLDISWVTFLFVCLFFITHIFFPL